MLALGTMLSLLTIVILLIWNSIQRIQIKELWEEVLSLNKKVNK